MSEHERVKALIAEIETRAKLETARADRARRINPNDVDCVRHLAHSNGLYEAVNIIKDEFDPLPAKEADDA